MYSALLHQGLYLKFVAPRAVRLKKRLLLPLSPKNKPTPLFSETLLLDEDGDANIKGKPFGWEGTSVLK